MENCHYDAESDASGMLSLWTELRTLFISGFQNTLEHFDFQIPLAISKLKLFNVVRCDSIKNRTMERFLDANPQLDEVKIRSCDQIQ